MNSKIVLLRLLTRVQSFQTIPLPPSPSEHLLLIITQDRFEDNNIKYMSIPTTREQFSLL